MLPQPGPFTSIASMLRLAEAQQALHFSVQLIKIVLLKATNRLKDSPLIDGAELKDQQHGWVGESIHV